MKKILSLLLIISLISICVGCTTVPTSTPNTANNYTPYTERYKDINSETALSLQPETRTFEVEIQGVPGGKKTGRYQEQGNKIVLEVDGPSFERYVFDKEGTSLNYDPHNSQGMASSSLDYSHLYRQ